MAKKPVYIGFASNISNKKVYDVDLIKQDLLNRINTRKGDRLMDPTFGSIIWDLIFEHKNEFIVNEINRDITSIVAADPRLTLQQLVIQEQEYGYVANLTLFFNGVNITSQLKIEFNQNLSSNPGIN